MDQKISQLLDNGQRHLELAKFKYYTGKTQEAETLVDKSVKELNECLSLYQKSSKIEKNVLASICNDAYETHGKIKGKQKQKISVSLDERLEWISSSFDGRFCAPVERNGISFVDCYSQFDDGFHTVSENQSKYFKEWQRIESDYWCCLQEELMSLYQGDFSSTCSFISSVISIANNNAKSIGDIIEPHGVSTKYLVKFFINGCQRKVFIDNRLPTSSSDQVDLVLKSTANSQLNWPAFIEKAYFKIRGIDSYNYNGSNAAFDTYMLSGWIPEYVKPIEHFTHAQNMESFWNCIYNSFKKKECLICIGTGNRNFGVHENGDRFLSSYHDYVVTMLSEDIDTGSKKMLVKNPWLLSNREKWIDYDFVCENFETIYLNWDCARLFDFKSQKRFVYVVSNDADPLASKGLFENPQFCVSNKSKTSSSVWLYLCEDMKSFVEQNKKYLIKFKTIKSDGERFFSMQSITNQYQSFETPNKTLLTKHILKPGESLTAIIDIQYTGQSNFTNSIVHSFSLTCYSEQPQVEFEKAQYKYKSLVKEMSKWSLENVGGNCLYSDYINNPQYKLELLDTDTNSSRSEFASITLALFVPDPEILYNVQIFWFPDTKGLGLQRYESKSLIHNENYDSKGERVFVDVKLQRNSTYLLLLSTYLPLLDLGLSELPYKMIISSDSNLKLTKVNSTTLGLFNESLVFNWNNSNRHVTYFRVSKRSSVNIRIKSIMSNNSSLEQSLQNMAIRDTPKIPEYSTYRPKMRANVFSNKDSSAVYHDDNFDDNVYGIFINKLVIESGIYVLLIERFELGEGQAVIKIGSDSKIQFLNKK